MSDALQCKGFQPQKYRQNVCALCYCPQAEHAGAGGASPSSVKKTTALTKPASTTTTAGTTDEAGSGAAAGGGQQGNEIGANRSSSSGNLQGEVDKEFELQRRAEKELEELAAQEKAAAAAVASAAASASAASSSKQTPSKQQQHQSKLLEHVDESMVMPSKRGRSETKTGIGFKDATADELGKQLMKEGFRFLILMAGRDNLGKKTFARALLKQYDETNFDPANPAAKSAATTAAINNRHTVGGLNTTTITDYVIHVNESGFHGEITVAFTHGFAANIANTAATASEPITKYIKDRFDSYLDSSFKDVVVVDNRVHVCLFFVEPYLGGLHPVELETISALAPFVNVIPIIAKRDLLTDGELIALKLKITEQLQQKQVQTFLFPGEENNIVWSSLASTQMVSTNKDRQKHMLTGILNDLKAVKGQQAQVEKLSSLIKSYMTAQQLDQNKEERVYGRAYPWGSIETENIKHSELSHLRENLLLTHRLHICKVTHEQIYHSYRKGKLQSMLSSGDKEAIQKANAELTRINQAQQEAKTALETEKKRLNKDLLEAENAKKNYLDENEQLKKQLADLEAKYAAAAITNVSDKKKK